MNKQTNHQQQLDPTAEDAWRQLDGKTVLVTGGSGSFGQAFARQVLDNAAPRRLIVFSRDEHKQYDMVQALASHPRESAMRYFIGDVRDADRLDMAMRDTDYVIHAAALKHVPTAEYNPFECIHTNVLGAENVARAAIRNNVMRVVALSTDKAASPVNLYGASKLAADKIFIAANNLSGASGTRFSVVRYGNVVGSRGSIVPLFRRLIAENAPDLPITDARMTRFWITLKQGVAFVVSSLLQMHGGEIFVPKIPSMKIVELAKCLAPDLPHRHIGIRPGEKIHEVMITEDDARNTVELDDRYVILPDQPFWAEDNPLRDRPRVPDGFRYASDRDLDWLDGDAMAGLLRETGD